MARLLAIGTLLVAFGMTSLAGAAPGAADGAEEAFQKGRALLAEGRYPEACNSFTESQRRDPASGTLLALAYCQELSGLLASAWTNYRAAAELAQREGQVERHNAAAGQFEVLSDRLSFLTVVVPPRLAKEPGLKVTKDGVALPPGQFGTAIPVDGGTYRIEASLPERGSWSATVSINSERDKKTLVVELVPATTTTVHSTQPAAAPVSSATTDEPSGLSTIEYAAIGTGVASVLSLGLGVGFALSANAKNNASNRDGHCNATGCDAEGMELRNDALNAATISTWSFVVGGAFAATSVGLYLGSKSGKKAATRLDVTANHQLARLSVTGEF
jgi:tetratricopeptide (TPR) repeat protein